jgi:hypothetical protein
MAIEIASVLRDLEFAEANLMQLERLCDDAIQFARPDLSFEPNFEYEERRNTIEDFLKELPPIDGWKPTLLFQPHEHITQLRLEGLESGEPSVEIAIQQMLETPLLELHEYRVRFNRKRRTLMNKTLHALVNLVDGEISIAAARKSRHQNRNQTTNPYSDALREYLIKIDVLLGSSVARPPNWDTLCQLTEFGRHESIQDVTNVLWPSVRLHLIASFGEKVALPLNVNDLTQLEPSSTLAIPIRLNWSTLTDESFERLIFAIFSNEPGYENLEWLTHTRASDRGRDLSVMYAFEDSLLGSRRSRVVIQCKHWQRKSVSLNEVVILREKMKSWRNPRVDILIIATSGRFTSEAVEAIERDNAGEGGLQIIMWPASRLEHLLAARPALIAEFKLR